MNDEKPKRKQTDWQYWFPILDKWRIENNETFVNAAKHFGLNSSCYYKALANAKKKKTGPKVHTSGRFFIP